MTWLFWAFYRIQWTFTYWWTWNCSHLLRLQTHRKWWRKKKWKMAKLAKITRFIYQNWSQCAFKTEETKQNKTNWNKIFAVAHKLKYEDVFFLHKTYVIFIDNKFVLPIKDTDVPKERTNETKKKHFFIALFCWLWSELCEFYQFQWSFPIENQSMKFLGEFMIW